MNKTAKYIVIFLFSIVFFLDAGKASAYQPVIVYSQSGDIQINNPEVFQSFYDELKGSPRDYFINSTKDFKLYINLLVPEVSNKDGRYSADIFLVKDDKEEKIASLDGASFNWQEIFGVDDRDYYLKGPEILKQLSAGKYKIEIYSHSTGSGQADNQGKYVLVVGKKVSYDIQSVLNIYWQLPLLKVSFFKTSVLQFFLTPFGIMGVGLLGGIFIFIALIYYIVGLIKQSIKHNQAKTLLLTSAGMVMKDDIIKLLQKPAYDITVAFINTAYKYKEEENEYYVNEDLRTMKEMGFNVEEIDIDGKKEGEVMKLLQLKDIIFVAGGNTFYLLKAMKACNFERVIRKLLKEGKVYIGASAGSIVAGCTIKPAVWFGDENKIGLKDLKGLNLVPYDIFAHYSLEYAEVIKEQIKNPKKRARKLKILTDEQALLIQGRETALIGKGEAVVI